MVRKTRRADQRVDLGVVGISLAVQGRVIAWATAGPEKFSAVRRRVFETLARRVRAACGNGGAPHVERISG